MSKIATTVNDLLHLEVDASDVLNQIANHSAQTGNTSGWTADAGVTLAAVANPIRLRENLCTYDADFELTTVGGSIGGVATVVKDTSWFDAGVRSVKITPAAGNNNSALYPTGGLGTSASQDRLGMGVIGSGTGPGVAFTISATIRLTAAQTSGTLNTLARRIVVGIRDSTGTDNLDVYRSDPAPNAAGIYRLKVTAYVKSTDQNVCVRLMNGSDLAADVVWWDSLLVEKGVTTGVWSETLQGTYSPGGRAIRATYASPATTSSYFYSPSFPVVPGYRVGLQFSIADSAAETYASTAALLPMTSYLYYDSNGNPVGSPLTVGATTVPVDSPWRMTVDRQRSLAYNADQTVPANAATARLRFRMVDAPRLGGAYTSLRRAVYISRVMLVIAPTLAAVNGVPFTDAAVWQNIAGSSIAVHISRGGDIDGVTDGIDAGTMTATILDAEVDPNNNPRIRPGRKLRLTMANPNGDGTFLPIFTGSLTEVNVDYSDLKRAATPRPRVSIVGSDAVSDLRGVASPYNYSGTLGQKVRALMASTTVAYSTDAGAVSTTKTSRNDSATLWDQLLLARNSFVNGKVWVDQSGVLNAKVSTSPYGASVLTFSDLAGLSYSKIQTTFGSKNLVNSLTITRTNADEVDGEKTYGPYLHGASIVAWKTVSAELDVIDGTPSAIATALLQRFGNPTVFPHSIEFSALDDQAWAASAALVELYALVQINYSKAGVSSQAFVIGIDHDISARGWYVTLTLRPSDATTSATITNGSGGMSAGPGDVIAPTPGPYAWRTQSTATSYASATWTSAELDTNQVMDGGITYDSTNRRFTVPRAGRWLINFAITWNPATAGRRVLRVLVNGQDLPPAVQSTHPAPAGASGVNNLVTMTVSKVLKLNAGDTVQPQVYQDSGAALIVYVSPVTDNYAELTYLGQ